MKAVVIEAESQETRVIELPREGALKPLQSAVGGLVECVALPQSKMDMWLNEEGKIVGLLTNQAATEIWRSEYGPTDIMAGDAVITGAADEEGYITSLSDEMVERICSFVAALRLATWGY